MGRLKKILGEKGVVVEGQGEGILVLGGQFAEWITRTPKVAVEEGFVFEKGVEGEEVLGKVREAFAEWDAQRVRVWEPRGIREYLESQDFVEFVVGLAAFVGLGWVMYFLFRGGG